jgi:hypothetical protein
MFEWYFAKRKRLAARGVAACFRASLARPFNRFQDTVLTVYAVIYCKSKEMNNKKSIKV